MFLVAQSSFDGQWKAQIPGLDLYLKIDSTEAYLTVPVQGIFKKKASSFKDEVDQMSVQFKDFGASFFGRTEGETIEGKWIQNGTETDMTWRRNQENIELVRTQMPKAPFSYFSQGYNFKSKEEGVVLNGTLTRPNKDGAYPTVILISGSGPQDRDESLMGHKPFLVWADYLTKRGFGVFRYDDRGVGSSQGKFHGATSKDFALDVEGAIDYLKLRKDVDKDKIFLVGHSEGGLIASMVASKRKDLAGIVMLAGPGQTGQEILAYQLKKQYSQLDVSDEGHDQTMEMIDKSLEILSSDVPNNQIIDKFMGHVKGYYLQLSNRDQMEVAKNEDVFYFRFAPMLLDPWMRSFLQTDPLQYISKIRVPVLAINGSKDTQVLQKPNLKYIKKALKEAPTKDFKTKCFKNKNHLFQNAKTGEADEYALIQETISPDVLEYVEKWLSKRK